MVGVPRRRRVSVCLSCDLAGVVGAGRWVRRVAQWTVCARTAVRTPHAWRVGGACNTAHEPRGTYVAPVLYFVCSSQEVCVCVSMRILVLGGLKSH